jgi:hypothetical protein
MQSQIGQSPKNRLTFNRLAVVHGRLSTQIMKTHYLRRGWIDTVHKHRNFMRLARQHPRLWRDVKNNPP